MNCKYYISHSFSGLLQVCFQALAVPELADDASDAICEAIILSKRSDSDPGMLAMIQEHISTLREVAFGSY